MGFVYMDRERAGTVNKYAPIMFNNPDKRTDLPDVVKEEFNKEYMDFDQEAIEKIKELRDGVDSR